VRQLDEINKKTIDKLNRLFYNKKAVIVNQLTEHKAEYPLSPAAKERSGIIF
jgi:hypothetical protein